MMIIFVLLMVLAVIGIWVLVYVTVRLLDDVIKLLKLIHAREKPKYEPQSQVSSAVSQSHSPSPSPTVVELPPDVIAPFLKRPPRPPGGYRSVDSETDHNTE
jgi:hypothetical protein